MSKMIKKIKSYTMQYRYILAVLVVIGALLVASNSQLQAGYVTDYGFTSPVTATDGELYLGAGQYATLTWTYEGDLNSDGYTVFDVFVKINSGDWTSSGNVSISGNEINYYLDGGLYEVGDIVAMKLVVYNTVALDKVWDDFTVFIIDPSATTTTEITTRTTTSGGGGSIIGPMGETFTTLLIIFGGVLIIMVVGFTMYMKVKR